MTEFLKVNQLHPILNKMIYGFLLASAVLVSNCKKDDGYTPPVYDWEEEVSLWLDPAIQTGFNHLDARVSLEYNKSHVEKERYGIDIRDALGKKRTRWIGWTSLFNYQGGQLVHVQDLDPDMTYYVRVFFEGYCAYCTPQKKTIYSQAYTVKTATPPGTDHVSDIDGNQYPVIQIGDQSWMAMNLQTGSFANGAQIDSIPYLDVNCPEKSAFSPAPDKNAPYHLEPVKRKIYNYFAAKDIRNICPNGWHVPTVSDIQHLAQQLGGWPTAGAHLKSELGWATPSIPATNSTGFTALPFTERPNCVGLLGLAIWGPWPYSWKHFNAKYWVLPDNPSQMDSVYSMILTSNSDSLYLYVQPAIEDVGTNVYYRMNNMNCVRCLKD